MVFGGFGKKGGEHPPLLPGPRVGKVADLFRFTTYALKMMKHQLDLYIRARYPLLWVVTAEEQRAVAEIEAIDRAAQAEIEHALQVAEAAPWPEAAAAYEDIMNSGAGAWRCAWWPARAGGPRWGAAAGGAPDAESGRHAAGTRRPDGRHQE